MEINFLFNAQNLAYGRNDEIDERIDIFDKTVYCDNLGDFIQGYTKYIPSKRKPINLSNEIIKSVIKSLSKYLKTLKK